MGATTIIILVILAILSGSNGMQYMPLDIDNQPCSAENLKVKSLFLLIYILGGDQKDRG